MNSLQLKIRNQASFRPIVKIDDKEVKLKKNEFGSLVANYSSEKEKVKISIYTLPHEFDTKYWFFIYLLYYVISIFGIFDVPYARNAYQLQYNGEIALQEKTVIDLIFESKKKDAKALTCKEGNFDDNESNKYIYNEKINKRRKIALTFKFCSWAIIAIGITLYLIFR